MTEDATTDGRGLDRRRLLALLGAGATTALVGALATRPDPAWSAVVLAEAKQGVDTVEEAQAAAAASAWGGHANGRIPSELLAPVTAAVAGSGLLRDDAAHQYFGLAMAFRAAVGRELVITEGYRSYQRQVEYWDRYQAGKGNLAAYPGTSNHGWGISCDFGAGVETAGSTAKRWMDANAPRFGWSPTGNGFSQKEPWHFDYVTPYPGPRSTRPDESGLVIVRVLDGLPGVGYSYTCVIGTRFLRHFTSMEKVIAMRSIGLPYREISAANFKLLLGALSVPLTAVTTDANYWRR
jgi:hypothetical protein